MWKLILAGTTALAMTGSSLVFAQQPTSKPDVAKPETTSPSAAEPADKADDGAKSSARPGAAALDIRLAVFKSGLNLSAEQEKNWAAFAAAAEDAARFRASRRQARREAPPPADPVARMHRRANALAEGAEVLKRLAEAAEPLYGSLDANQKQRFAVLMRVLGPRRPAMGGWHQGMGMCGAGPGAPFGRQFGWQGQRGPGGWQDGPRGPGRWQDGGRAPDDRRGPFGYRHGDDHRGYGRGDYHRRGGDDDGYGRGYDRRGGDDDGSARGYHRRGGDDGSYGRMPHGRAMPEGNMPMRRQPYGGPRDRWHDGRQFESKDDRYGDSGRSRSEESDSADHDDVGRSDHASRSPDNDDGDESGREPDAATEGNPDDDGDEDDDNPVQL
jgi:hypothetical protein